MPQIAPVVLLPQIAPVVLFSPVLGGESSASDPLLTGCFSRPSRGPSTVGGVAVKPGRSLRAWPLEGFQPELCTSGGPRGLRACEPRFLDDPMTERSASASVTSSLMVRFVSCDPRRASVLKHFRCISKYFHTKNIEFRIHLRNLINIQNLVGGVAIVQKTCTATQGM